MNKAQSAMEFLMTYGWAMLVIMIVGGAIFFILPSTTQDVCSIDSLTFSCSGHRFIAHETGSNIINLVYANIANNNNYAINVIGIACLSPNSKTPSLVGTKFENFAFNIPQTAPDKPLILHSGEQFNTGSIADNRFKLQCFEIDAHGNLNDLNLQSGDTFEGDLYILYKRTNEPASTPAILKKGKINVLAQ